MKNDKNKKLFHDLKNAIVSIKMGIDLLKDNPHCLDENPKLILQIDEAILKLNQKWEEVKGQGGTA